ncbi:reprolysin-like metallopeptidase [Pseudotenacibaculum sp. MALMAid0570]|uniref:zinc-dependent metalloprotease n=1 Tax=Pseudotenacibaculum sp. MALMAid0570 TaxID=3143938 RepID=UPI0032DF9399
MKIKLPLKIFCALFFVGFIANAQETYWKKSKISSTSKIAASKNLKQDQYHIFSLDVNAFKTQLTSAPLRTDISSRSNVVVNFPNQDGKLERFSIVEAPVLSPKLAAEHPNIKTYLGYGIDSPGARIRFSVTPQGIQTMTSYMDRPNVFTVPTEKGNTSEYITYNRGVRVNSVKDFECMTENEFVPIKDRNSVTSRDANDQILRTFRIAISTNGEYTNFWDDGNAGNGDAQADALAQVVSTLNRNNEVFEVDMAVTFQLVTGTELIFTNAATDPYSVGGLNNQLQTTLTNTVGEANYDIGHLLAYGGKNGNAGCIGCVCVNGQKGSAFSSHDFLDNDGGAYMADFFDIDYVPHEIGHQMGALHTHAAADNNAVNFEPGSGTTIMGYAGITGSNDVQDHSDPYFHYGSINQILNNLITRTCWTSTPIANNPPVANAGNDYTIPQGTAFVLKGSATDADGGDVLTYTWEQIDDGYTTRSDFSPTLTSGPLWRSRPPTTNTDRYMPVLARVLAGQLTETNPLETPANTSWETVSTVSRTLNFALTVRDRSEANGTGQFPQSDFDFMTVTVDGASGPFSVTSQNSAVEYDVGTTQTVTWLVGGTDVGNVNTPTVNIRLSIDGGLTYPFLLASDVPNDGSHDVGIPVIGGETSTARIMVEGHNNIFFAVNSSNFSIKLSEFAIAATNSTVTVCSPDNAVYNLTYNTFLGFTDVTNFTTEGLPAGATGVFNPTSASADGTAFTLTVSGTNSLAAGSYPFTVKGTSGAIERTVPLTLNVFNPTIAAPNLTAPADTTIDFSATGTLMWDADANVENYLVEVATDNGFANIVESNTVQTNSYTLAGLSNMTQYFWRVTPSNQCATGTVSSVFSFTTANLTCNTFDATDLPQTISTSGAGNVYTSTITVTPDFPITDVNVTFSADHTWAADLDVFLISPNGTRVELTTDNDGGVSGADDYTDTVFDQEAATSITDGSAPFTGTFRPEGDLSTIYGEMSGGDWVLEVTDDANLDGGTFTRFSLNLCVQGDILSTREVEGVFTNMSLYPNPSDGEFSLSFDTQGSDKVKLQLFDIAGRMVKQLDYENISARFARRVSFNGVSKGFYLLKIVNGTKFSTKKIVIE